MSRIFISGSSTGLGLMAGELLVEQGHQVVLHARNAARAEDARLALPQAEAVVEGDLDTIAGAKALAQRVNDLGRFDAVIHNAAVGYRERHHPHRGRSPACLRNQYAVRLYPDRIDRHVRSGWCISAPGCITMWMPTSRIFSGRSAAGTVRTAYAESKLHDAMLAFAVARRWPEVFSNSLEPGWVPTQMGGPGAPDDMDQAHLTQAWLASGDDPKSQVTGKYFYHLKRMEPNPQAHDPALQARLIAICAEISGVTLPRVRRTSIP